MSFIFFLLALISLLSLTLSLCLTFDRSYDQFKEYFLTEEQKAIVDEIISSLGNGDEWDINEYHAVNEKYYIWWGNKNFGLFVSESIHFGHYAEPGKTLLGKAHNVTAFSTFLGWSVPWRRKILQAVKNEYNLQKHIES